MNFFIIARKLYINRNIYLIFYQFILHISNYYYYKNHFYKFYIIYFY